ncbi:MAG: M16 family metallopeptidase [Myxococcaceae bacterium]
MRWCAHRSWRSFLLTGLLGTGGAAALPAGVALRNISFQMKSLELPSGMRIVIEEDHSQPLVVIVSVVDVGSAQDPEGKEGLAHLVEHLTFRAKPDGRLQRSTLLDFAAAGYWNAFTGHDLTTYETIGPREALAQLLALEGKRLLSPLQGLDARAFEVERAVVKNEITQRDEAGEVSAIQAQLYGTLYPKGHPYHRPVGGTEASISSLSLADAESFVREHYLPRNITFYVSGDLDLATIEKVFDANFPHEFLDAPAGGPVAPAHRVRDGAPPVPALPAPTRLQTIRAPAERPMLYIAWSLPGGFGAQRYLERFARSVLSSASALAATPGSDIAGLATSLDEGRYGNTLVCSVFLKEGKDPERSLERVLDQAVRIWAPAESGIAKVVTAERGFERLQKTAIVGLALQTESPTARALDKATLIHWTGDPAAWGKDMQGLVDLSRSKVEAFAYDWFTRARARAVFVEPSGERTFESVGTPGVFTAPDVVHVSLAPEALSTYVHGPASEVHSFALKNGLEVLLVRRASAPTVAVTLGVRGGSATSEPLGAAVLAARLASPTQIGNGPPAKYGVRLSLSSSPDVTYYTGQAASGNLENVLAMMSDGVQSLHVDGGRYDWGELVKGYRRNDALPSIQADRAFLRQAFLGSALGRVATADDIAQLGAGDLQTWIDRSIRPRGAVLAVVGDIDPVEAEKEIRDWLESWQGEQDPRAEAPPASAGEEAVPTQVRVIRIDRPGVKQTDIRLGCSVRTENSADRIAVRLLAGRIRGRLWNLARTSLGGSYGFSGGASFYRQRSFLAVEGSVDDQTLTRVLAVARRELDELGSVKPNAEELGLLKWRQGIASNIRFATNAQLAAGLVSTRLASLPLDAVSKYPEQLAAVTVEDVARVAAGCRTSAVLLLTGDPAVVGKALQATAR